MAVSMDSHCYYYYESQLREIAKMHPTSLAHAISRAIALKKRVVETDEYDVDKRMVLNFGHTLGHAFESGQNFAIAHGKAVGLGMLAESTFSEHMGWSKGVRPSLEELLAKLGVNSDWKNEPMNKNALKYDKKNREQQITLPIVTTLGKHRILNTSLEALETFLHEN
jgi:3-dehydroquinate synthase